VNIALNRSEKKKIQTTEEEGRITSTWVEIINKAAAFFLLYIERERDFFSSFLLIENKHLVSHHTKS
jgi:hypothetical protein